MTSNSEIEPSKVQTQKTKSQEPDVSRQVGEDKGQEPKAKGQNLKEDEIDLIDLIKVIWSKKWFVAKVTGVFLVLGLIIAFTSPEEYETSSSLISEMMGQEGKIGGSLGGLASLAGVDLGGLSGGSGKTINPALYQSVSRSTPFLLELMYQEYYFSEVGEKITLYDYYINHYKTSLFGQLMSIPGVVIGWIKGDFVEEDRIDDNNSSSVLTLTKYQQRIVEDLKSRVFVEMDWELNVVTIQVEMQDPEVAAEMVHFTQNYITKYVIDYAVSKSKQQLKSIERQYEERKMAFEQSQYQLALFRDKNQHVNTAQAKSGEERLLSEYNLTFNIYNQIAQQREAIKLQIQEKTPVFTVLEPVKIPVEKSKPKRILILVSFLLLGGMVGMLYSLFIKYSHGAKL